VNADDFFTVMAWFGDNDMCEEVSWHRRSSAGGMRVLVGCSDVFWWGTADCEPVEVADLPDLEKARLDLANAGDPLFDYYAPALWVARKRGMRPQTPWWNRERIPIPVRDLFLAAGPVRDRKDEG
jgi:hypothetical protein